MPVAALIARPTAAIPAGADPRATRRALRRRLFGGLVAVILVTAGGWFAYGQLFPSGLVTTDDAYVGADVANVTALESGIVTHVEVEDAQPVKAGQMLVRLDDRDAALAVASAEAALERAQRAYDENVADSGATGAAIKARLADAETARDLLARKSDLYAQGWVTRQDFVAARDASRSADASVEVARQQNAASLARVSNMDRAHAPDVAAAAAALAQARLNLARTRITAPVDGIVTGRAAETGEQVAPGTPLMSIVPVGRAYVDANFTEKQLAHVRPGLPATLTSDEYGPDVVFHGTVAGVGGGTGSAFALVPAQNATGNWIKVVQRVPVRIRLAPEDLAAHPLRVGLSMKASVDTTGVIGN